MVSKPQYTISGQYSLSTFRCQLSAVRCPVPNPGILISMAYFLTSILPTCRLVFTGFSFNNAGTEILRFAQNDSSGGQSERLSSIFYLLSSNIYRLTSIFPSW